MDLITGKAIVLGDDVDTDQILPGYAMAEPYDKLGGFAMAGLVGPDFRAEYEPGCILVAGRNFGCGSSREQAPIALKQAGISLIMAAGFARIFRRNAINIGLPVWRADLIQAVRTGDRLTVDLEQGTVLVQGRRYSFAPLADSTRRTLAYGGLIPRVRAELKIQGDE